MDVLIFLKLLWWRQRWKLPFYYILPERRGLLKDTDCGSQDPNWTVYQLDPIAWASHQLPCGAAYV